MKDIFAKTAIALISGKILCEYSTPDEYAYLVSPAAYEDMDDYLRRIRMTLKSAPSGDATWAIQMDIDDPKTQAALRASLSSLINDYEPLVRFMQLLKELGTNDRPISPGDTLKEAELLQVIQDGGDRLSAESLRELCSYGMFKNGQTTHRGRLTSVLEKLVDSGHLIRRREGIYQATGAWSLVYARLSYIASHEELLLEEEDGQTSLAL